MRTLTGGALALMAAVLWAAPAQAGELPWVTLKSDGYERKFRELRCQGKGDGAARTGIVLSGKTPGNLRLQVLARETPRVPGRLRIWNGDRGKRGGHFGTVTRVRLWGKDITYEKFRIQGRFTSGRKQAFVITGRCGCDPGSCNGIDGRAARALVRPDHVNRARTTKGPPERAFR